MIEPPLSWLVRIQEEGWGTWSVCAICCKRLAPIRLAPSSYFRTCWKVSPSALAKLLLAHAQHHPPHSHAAPHMFVNRIRRLSSSLGTCR